MKGKLPSGFAALLISSVASAQQANPDTLEDCIGTVCFEEMQTTTEPESEDNQTQKQPDTNDEQINRQITFADEIKNTETATTEAESNVAPQPATTRETAETNGEFLQQQNPADQPAPEQQPSESVTTQNTTPDASPPVDVKDQQRNGPGLFEVDEVAAVRALERSLTQIDALLMPVGAYEFGIDFSFGFDSSRTPIFIEIEDEDGNTAQALSILDTERRSAVSIFDFRTGLPRDSQITVSLPYLVETDMDKVFFDGSIVDIQTESVSGIGDLSIALSKGLLSEKGMRPDLIASVSYNSDTGGTDDGVNLGSGAQEYSLGLTMTKRQDPLVFTGSLSMTNPVESDGFKAGNSQSISLSALLGASPNTSMSFGFSQTFFSEAESDGQRISGTSGYSGSYTFGISSVVGRDVFLSASLSSGLSDTAGDYTFSFGISRRFER